MSERQTSEITQILQDWNDGDADAGERLLPFVYKELKRNARFLMAKKRANHTLQPTALVHRSLSQIDGIDGNQMEKPPSFLSFRVEVDAEDFG